MFTGENADPSDGDRIKTGDFSRSGENFEECEVVVGSRDEVVGGGRGEVVVGSRGEVVLGSRGDLVVGSGGEVVMSSRGEVVASTPQEKPRPVNGAGAIGSMNDFTADTGVGQNRSGWERGGDDVSCSKVVGEDVKLGLRGAVWLAGDSRQHMLNAPSFLVLPRRRSSKVSPSILDGSSSDVLGGENAGNEHSPEQ